MQITKQSALQKLLEKIGNDDAEVKLVIDGEELPDGIEVNYDPETNSLLIEPCVIRFKYEVIN